MREYYDHDSFYPCECDSEFIRLTKFKDEPFIYFDKYRVDTANATLLQRIRLAFMFIINPDKYDIHGGVILRKEDARKLGENLMKVTVEKPKDIFFGKNNMKEGEPYEER